jgi:hypothetical protein
MKERKVWFETTNKKITVLHRNNKGEW